MTPGLLAELLSHRDELSPADRDAMVSWLEVLTREQAGAVYREWYRRDVDSLEKFLRRYIPDEKKRNLLRDYLARTFKP